MFEQPCDYQLSTLTTMPHSKERHKSHVITHESLLMLNWFEPSQTCLLGLQQRTESKHLCVKGDIYLCRVPLFTLAPALQMCLFSCFHIPCGRSTAVNPKAADGLWWRSSESWTNMSRQRLFLSNVLLGYWVKCLVVWSSAQNSYSHDPSFQKTTTKILCNLYIRNMFYSLYTILLQICPLWKK